MYCNISWILVWLHHSIQVQKAEPEFGISSVKKKNQREFSLKYHKIMTYVFFICKIVMCKKNQKEKQNSTQNRIISYLEWLFQICRKDWNKWFMLLSCSGLLYILFYKLCHSGRNKTAQRHWRWINFDRLLMCDGLLHGLSGRSLFS